MKIVLILITFLFASFSTYSLEFSVIHTNDLHSRFLGDFGNSRGHYARLATSIKNELKKNRHSLLVDAGDFFSGSLIHTLAVQASIPYFPEYQFFDALNYDAITLGNHEFDAGELGFNIMLSKVRKLGARVPIISTNLDSNFKLIKKSVVKVFKSNLGHEVRVGLIGALGPDGCAVSRGTRGGIKFIGYDDKSIKERWSNLKSTLTEEVRLLKKDKVDIIILLFHGGEPEDSKLAKEIKGVDIIVAGHTHEVYFKKVGKTYIAQAGSYASNLGVLKITFNEAKKKIDEVIFSEIKIDEKIEKDNKIQEQIYFHQRTVNNFLNRSVEGVSKLKNKTFIPKKNYIKAPEFFNELGIEVTTAIAQSISRRAEDFDVYFTSLSLIRANLLKNKEYRLENIFTILPIGFDEKLKPGAKVLSFYLRFGEFKKLLQFLELYSKLNSKFIPAFSSALDFKIKGYGIPFINRISDIKIKGHSHLQEKSLIHIGTNSFVFKYLDFIKKKSFGIVNLIPRDAKGNPIKDVYQYGPEYLEYAKARLK